jgi:hypothetical protein
MSAEPLTVERVRVWHAEEVAGRNHELPRWDRVTRQAVGVLLAEIDRLKAGRFTEEEFQDLCHTFTPDDRERFEAGCRAYQDRLFGGRPAAAGEGTA